MSVETSTQNGTELAALKERLDKLQEELVSQRRSMEQATGFMAAAGVIILLVIGGYFLYAYKRIQSVTDPEKLVDVAQTMIDENLPRARDSLQREIVRSAPAWAEGLSRKAQESMPDMRRKAVTYLTEEAEQRIQEASLMTEKTFREFVTKNRPMLEAKYKEIATSPKLAEKSLAELQLPLDDQLNLELRLQAADAIRSLGAANRNLRYLQADKSLTPDQKVERQVWMIVRRLQMEQMAEPERLASPKNPVKKPTPPHKKTEKPARKDDKKDEKTRPPENRKEPETKKED